MKTVLFLTLIFTSFSSYGSNSCDSNYSWAKKIQELYSSIEVIGTTDRFVEKIETAVLDTRDTTGECSRLGLSSYLAVAELCSQIAMDLLFDAISFRTQEDQKRFYRLVKGLGNAYRGEPGGFRCLIEDEMLNVDRVKK